jgi:hypothetical protein
MTVAGEATDWHGRMNNTLDRTRGGTSGRRLPALRPLAHQVHRTLSQPIQDAILRKLIGGRRVFVLGSGPSAAELTRIPDDVLLFSCNVAPEALLQKGLHPPIDLYIANAVARRNYGLRVNRILDQLTVRNYLTRSPRYIRSLGNLRCERVLYDRATEDSNYLLRRWMDKTLVDDLAARTWRGIPSSGVALLIHALVYGAREIYCLGLDLDDRGHAVAGSETDPRIYVEHHQQLDHGILRHANQRFGNVFSVSPNSPLRRFVPHRPV